MFGSFPVVFDKNMITVDFRKVNKETRSERSCIMGLLCYNEEKDKGLRNMTELETMQRAKMYLDKLARGVDPITDRELPEDAPGSERRIPGGVL